MDSNSSQKLNLKSINLSEMEAVKDAFQFWDNDEDAVYDQM